MRKELKPLAEVIDALRDGVNDAFMELGYDNVAFVLVAQDGNTGFGGMAATCDNEGSKTLLGVALQQIEKGKPKIIVQ